MEAKRHTILVPTDFSEISRNAIFYAYVLAKKEGNTVTLLHIIKDESEMDKASQQIEQLAKAGSSQYNIETDFLVRKGSIFSTIGEVSKELKAELVLMGTHGRTTMQKLTGSWALKVVVSSKAPVVVVKNPPTDKGFEKIVFPIDFTKECREKLFWAHYLYKLYNSKIFILKENVSDVGFMKGIRTNIAFTKEYFEKYGIKYEIKQAEGNKSFADETLDYASEIEADLILIMTTKKINFIDYILAAPEQHIIDNAAKIPVMCVNPAVATIDSFSFPGMGI
ncbi:MAG: universal stress protein [Bacteroidota bacterium]|nr:universal stress protein [Bacteroidota bacterium]MDP4225193.1 universal stress protein [Bacteroidota bacterium]MDP4274976.1 universal stress protein [Bacteroidota bacterium]